MAKIIEFPTKAEKHAMRVQMWKKKNCPIKQLAKPFKRKLRMY